MFFRLKSTKSGKVLKLLESFRDCEGVPRHRTVVSLGTPSIDKSQYKRIAYLIEKHFYNKTMDDLIYESELTPEDRNFSSQAIRKIESENRWIPVRSESSDTSKPVKIQIEEESINHETNSELGPVLVCKKAWDDLKIETILKENGISPNRIQSSMISVINRLVDPVSENRLIEWYRSTALGDIIKDPLTGAGTDRFYRASDDLVKAHTKIEKSLRKETHKLHSPNRTIILYDLTNSHFEGVCSNNTMAKRGRNKQKRNDCPQIVIGMLFDQSGFELGHKMFSGNQSDSKSLPKMINTMKDIVVNDSDSHTPLVVMDSGMSSEDNLAQLRNNTLFYLVNDKRPSRERYGEYFINKDGFELIPDRDKKSDVNVKLLEETNYEVNEDGSSGSEYKEKLLLCISKGRAQKESAIIDSADKKLLEELKAYQHKIQTQKKLISQKEIDKNIGKIQAKHSRVQRFYAIASNYKTRKFEWKLNKDKFKVHKDLSGCYVLRTNSTEIKKEEIWQTYISLTTAEKGFKTLKGNLGLRPNFHQNTDRVNGHVFITILAYILLRHITIQLEKENDFRDWESIRRVLKTHAYATIIFKTVSGNMHRIRKAGIPSEDQKTIYSILGINWKKLPKTNIVIKSKY